MKQYLAIAIAFFTLSACSLPQRGENQPIESWNNKVSATISTQEVTSNQGLVVFYRPANIDGPAVNVYINGDYQTSLLENGFSAIALCADQNFFSSSLSTNQKGGNRTQGVKFISPSKQITYIKVKQVRKGIPVFEFVKPEVATTELAGLQMQAQTLSRVKQQDCSTTDYALLATQVNSNIAFPLNKHGYSDLSAAGQQDIQQFAQTIKNLNQQAVSRVVVNGYTDPEGSEVYNQKLSEKRATTVSNALKQEGVNLPVVVVGYGEKALVVDSCAADFPNNKVARNECNLPNRRVEVVVYGQE
ncbi:OmpA family protein [Pasteurella testudinis]|uniref:OmpA family protein n=1 Tax=Pasteurella testudinis TaxID=761 RepID=UPI0040581297